MSTYVCCVLIVLGSCGVWHKNWEPTVALSRELMDNWPGYNGLNPNNNPYVLIILMIRDPPWGRGV